MEVMRIQPTIGAADALMRSFFHRSVSTVRNWMLLGVLLFSLFGVLDIYYTPIHLKLAWSIRFGIIIPLLLFFYIITFIKSLNSHLSVILVCFVTTAIVGTNALSAVADSVEKGFHFWFVGLLLIMFWLHNTGLNTRYLWILHGITLVTYNVSAIFFQQLHIQSLEVLIGNNSMIIKAILMSIASSRIVESFIQEDHNTKRELEQALIVKERILSVVSHDIRGPLASIKGLLNLCASGRINQDELRTNAKMLTESVDALQGLLDSIFIWNMGGNGNFPVEKKRLNLYNLVLELTRSFAPIANRKFISIYNKIDTSIMVVADPVVLKLVVRNLLSNAFRFTVKGDITIRATQTHDTTFIYVENTGSVVDQEIVKLLLNGIDSISTTSYNGKGFGLAICKELVERHGGSFFFQTNGNAETSMYFTLTNPQSSESLVNHEEKLTSYCKVRMNS